MNNITIPQFELVYNSLSFGIAAMGAATLFLWLSRTMVATAYRTAVTISGLVTAIAFYHYIRIFESWNGAYTVINGTITATGIKFNDAYRYVDWLLTVPLLLIELILVMRLSQAETTSKGVKLGALAAVMILLGYPGEVSGDMTGRWIFWALSMIPFTIIVAELFGGLKKSIDTQPEGVRGLVSNARFLTVASWCFYPVVFLLPMLGLNGGAANVAVQVGYTIADVVAKAVFGIFIYAIAVKKSQAEAAA
jgi:bacteriorhodopsin